MANIKQQKKRIRVAERQRLENIRYRSSIKTAFRRVVEAVQSGDAEAVASAHATFVALIDRGAAKRALHPNTAARKKARVSRVIARGPQAEESKKRRVSKKAAPAQQAAPGAEAAADEPAADAVVEEAAEAPTGEPEAAADASADAPEAEAGDDADPADEES